MSKMTENHTLRIKKPEGKWINLVQFKCRPLWFICWNCVNGVWKCWPLPPGRITSTFQSRQQLKGWLVGVSWVPRCFRFWLQVYKFLYNFSHCEHSSLSYHILWYGEWSWLSHTKTRQPSKSSIGSQGASYAQLHNSSSGS